MTAEIVLLNREAVVMAADSAATVEERGVTKIYHSENKLFMLSKYRPIGVMIYNNVHLCGVPWETIIKEYRKEIKDASFETLREYADSFLNYLRDNQYLFSPDQQFDDNAHAIVRRLTELHKLYEREISQGTKRLAALGAVLDKKIIELQAKPYLAGFDRDFEEQIIRGLGETTRLLAKEIFKQKKSDEDLLKRLNLYIALSFSRAVYPEEATGLVITGFGEKEIFPRLRCFTIDGIVFDRLRMSEGREEVISLDNPATWRSFARSEVVASIIGGIHPAYRNNFLQGAFSLVHGNVIATLNEITELTPEQRKSYEDALTNKAIEAWQKYFREMGQYARDRFEEPVRRSLDGLGKDDLAKIAESLVSITSFRQQISPEEETVGGPIDVAVISKGDGFVWIKRKFYFDIKFNPHFIERYYQNT